MFTDRARNEPAGLLAGLFTFRLVGNRPQSRTLELPIDGPPGSGLLIVEFDDQGLLFDDRPLALLERRLEALRDRHPVIVVFAHGWKHNAAPADPFLAQVRALLSQAASASARPVLGLYLAWRGLSLAGDWLWENASFWGRQSAAERVAVGTPREILGRLRRFRNGPSGEPPRASLLIVGHSFGALIVFTAIAQSLIDAAASTGPVVPSFGDLVLLINPAFSAIAYLPVQAIIDRRCFTHQQLPVFVAVTALNDDATGILYPIGNFWRPLFEATRGVHERQALTRTVGHLAWLRTHMLSLAGQVPAADPSQGLLDVSQAGARAVIGGVLVTATGQKQDSPFWVASATRQIIDGHDGIFLPPFERFVAALLAAHAATPKPAPG